MAPKQAYPSPNKSQESKEVELNFYVDISSLSFPQRTRQLNFDLQFKKFYDNFKKLHINIRFANASYQMPSYAKFLMEFLANNMQTDLGTITFNEEYWGCAAKQAPIKNFQLISYITCIHDAHN